MAGEPGAKRVRVDLGAVKAAAQGCGEAGGCQAPGIPPPPSPKDFQKSNSNLLKNVT